MSFLTNILSILIISFGMVQVGVASVQQIQVKGSDTEVNLVQMIAEQFMKKNKTVSISVTGGGSGTGIAALFNKTADLANSSRALKDDELANAKAQGMEPKRVIFATDALSLVVNDTNPIKTMTVAQAGAVFRGEIKNWKELGGADEKISLYGRQSNSGTYVFFRDQVVKGDYSADTKLMNGNSQIVEGVARDKAAIGYVGIGYALDRSSGKPMKGLKLLTVAADDKTKAIDPKDAKNVVSGKYPIARPLYQYFVKADVGLVEFLKFELSPAGMEFIKKEGFYEIRKEWKAENDKVLKELAKH